MAGIKGKSGRKRKFSRAIHDYLDQHKANIPEYLDELHAQALAFNLKEAMCPKCFHKFTIEVRGGGNFMALQWFLDHYYGKAPQSLDIKTKSIVITGEQLSELLPLLLQHDEQLLLESGTSKLESATSEAEAEPES